MQVLALDILHDQEMDAARLAGIEGRDDVRMNQADGRLRFALKTGHGIGRNATLAEGGNSFKATMRLHAAVLGP